MLSELECTKNLFIVALCVSEDTRRVQNTPLKYFLSSYVLMSRKADTCHGDGCAFVF